MLQWGANFSPATQNGQWWRLATAVFLHFGIIHLTLNVWALWDGGQWVERMYGPMRFLLIFITSGVVGNLFSLTFHVISVVSAGASGGIFGVYGALLSYLWLNRTRVPLIEFRWVFFGAVIFSLFTIVFGFLVDGIDNAAHGGGLITGLILGALLIPRDARQLSRISLACVVAMASAVLVIMLLVVLPDPVPLQPLFFFLSNEADIRR
ncbi:rhomboid family intramembrane serine protease [Hahella aquimaris]|uniref:rhomboid family intramembrane serine protease n=1 Tax=Hahella sp. HNIBRBA332 TaxID=3015983 RepID=UPI00273CEA49|nr:rhomboid family intramembrane serine protease [Hahella sp. HNIBRBA332]WLQ16360.1 rhomboid family intramembrane serine protease [Hahella sp. HNIBRBA332]